MPPNKRGHADDERLGLRVQTSANLGFGLSCPSPSSEAARALVWFARIAQIAEAVHDLPRVPGPIVHDVNWSSPICTHSKHESDSR